MAHNKELMAQARNALAGRWGLAAVATLLYIVVMAIAEIIPIAGVVIGLLIGGPFVLGYVLFTLSISRGLEAKSSMIFDGFKNFAISLGTYLLMAIFTILWCLLLIVPGIIAALSYSMAFFILAENPNIGSLEAITASKKMMMGYKWKYFCLNWRFFWWGLLCVLTLGIGFLWLMPYMYVSFAKFYEDIKPKAAAEPVVEPVAA